MVRESSHLRQWGAGPSGIYMTDKLSVSGPVVVEQTTKEAVAFKLMEKIVYFEDKKVPKDRKYWLTLYHQCLKTTSGYTLKTIFEDE